MALETKVVSVLTWNVWFGGAPWDLPKLRYKAIVKEVLKHLPEVACFQEVTLKFFDVLSTSKEINANYKYDARESGSYQTLILTKREIVIKEKKQIRFKSNQNRDFKYYTCELPGQEGEFTVGTVHLESMKMASANRLAQLEQILPILTKKVNGFLVGDFNFCATGNENKEIEKYPFCDIWTALRKEEKGWTENTELNHMRYRMKPRRKLVRFDRILLNQDNNMTPLSIELLGTKEIPGSGFEKYEHGFLQLPSEQIHDDEKKNLFPSDHFGLIAKFKFD